MTPREWLAAMFPGQKPDGPVYTHTFGSELGAFLAGMTDDLDDLEREVSALPGPPHRRSLRHLMAVLRCWWSGHHAAGALLVWCCAAVVGAECPVSCSVDVGPVAVIAVVWYAHEAEPHGGHPYTYTTPPLAGPGHADLDQIEGCPVAVEWWTDSALIRRCGTRPDRIFWDGFETGTLNRWRTGG